MMYCDNIHRKNRKFREKVNETFCFVSPKNPEQEYEKLSAHDLSNITLKRIECDEFYTHVSIVRVCCILLTAF